ncbi:hypothetical protein [Phenylobacterium sp.]|uniref:hypothetical protein n=1 Tax=Phenylobacterium sp. TaxID=1871053 RepID=UPI00120EE899|nr:hypothetical protein [Phenylobacterium sp.]THD61576.1 MAG: hypothetical protein E8A49_11425 [Phenylobacterium sp.]
MWRLAVPALVLGLIVAVAGYFGAPARAQIAVQNQGYVPFSDAPIYYRSAALSDPVAVLQRQIADGKVKLTYEPGHGYLKSVLALLKVPQSSQTLVFSKTSFQSSKISPQQPRALYYNDDVYVGAVHDGKAIELISFDPKQGAIFYLLNEPKADQPAFQRAELDCTQCHIAAGTRGVPGVLLRSVFPNSAGVAASRAASYITDQKSPQDQRWGGWYVTGALAAGSMGNATIAQVGGGDPAHPSLAPLPAVDTSAYLNPGSDQVALLVLAHQTQMHNLITLTNYQTRLALYALNKGAGGGAVTPSLDALPEATRAQIEKPAEQLLRYMLFVDETPLGGLDARKAIATSDYAREFAARGPRDARRRSLRDFDLHDRIFRYPCSYLIYSDAFDALPEPAKGYVYHRLLQVLTSQDQSPDFANLKPADRQAILSILLDTKPGLPAEWRDHARASHLRTASLRPINAQPKEG